MHDHLIRFHQYITFLQCFLLCRYTFGSLISYNSFEIYVFQVSTRGLWWIRSICSTFNNEGRASTKCRQTNHGNPRLGCQCHSFAAINAGDRVNTFEIFVRYIILIGLWALQIHMISMRLVVCLYLVSLFPKLNILNFLIALEKNWHRKVRAS